MREIKFRAWYGNENKMYKVHRLECNNSNANVAVEIDSETRKYVNDSMVDIMQYTGLKDKNGKEIYEKDLFGGTWEGGFVDYCDSCKGFQYYIPDFGCTACQGDVHWYELVEEDGKIEVIGNIYESPELLK